MGLSINSGPKWKDDSHNYINRDTTEMNIQERTRKDDLTNKLNLMYSNPIIDQEFFND